VQDLAVGQPVLPHLGDVEEARMLVVGLLLGLVGDERRRLARDEVGVLLLRVDRRRVAGRRNRDNRDRRGAASGLGAPPGVAGSGPQQRAERRTGEQDGPDRDRRRAEDGGAGASEQVAAPRLEAPSHVAAVVVAERQQQAGERHRQPRPERPHVDERAARDHEDAHRGQDERRRVGGGPEGVPEAAGYRPADHSAVPAGVEDAPEEDAERGEPEPDQLGMVVAARPAPLAARLHTLGQLRAQLPLALLARHAAEFCGAGPAPASAAGDEHGAHGQDRKEHVQVPGTWTRLARTSPGAWHLDMAVLDRAGTVACAGPRNLAS
jgi:hypothetical protein